MNRRRFEPRAASVRPPKLRIGPGFALALIFAGAVLWHQRQEPNYRGESPAQVARASAAEPPPPPLAPEPGWLLRRADAIGLNPAQRDQLRRQAAAWDQATWADRAGMAAAQAELERYLTAHRADGTAGQETLHSAASGYSERSAALAVQRQEAWNWARSQLTAEQIATVDRLRSESPLELR